MSNTVYSLWIGSKLPRLQRLCVESWLWHGYAYRIFVYQDVVGIPAGATVLDGEDVLPVVHLYTDEKHVGHPALHANVFRYTWLAKYGGTWVDADTCCLRRLPNQSLIISSEAIKSAPWWFPDLAVCRVPPAALFMETCRAMAEQRLQLQNNKRWGQYGPKLLREVLRECGLHSLEHVSPPQDYCPIPCWLSKGMCRPHSLPVPRDSYGCHMWSASCRADGVDIDAVQDPDSAYERILAQSLQC